MIALKIKKKRAFVNFTEICGHNRVQCCSSHFKTPPTCVNICIALPLVMTLACKGRPLIRQDRMFLLVFGQEVSSPVMLYVFSPTDTS